MQTFLYIEINTFALGILFLIFLNMYNRSERFMTDQKLFLALLIANALTLIVDSGMWLFDGGTGFIARELNLFVTVVYYLLTPISCMIWSAYVDYQVYRNEKRLKKIFLTMLIPIFLNIFLTVLSIYKNCLFYIDSSNTYHRGSMFYLTILISYTYLITTFIFILKKRNKIQKKNYVPLIVFAIPPFMGGIIQILFYGISLIWICMSFSIFMLFINIQNNQLYTDYLTNVFNRRQLDFYLQKRIQNLTDKCALGGIMIDLNSFKAINDLYGHFAGDQALIHTAEILKNTFQKNDFIARYGGDEFIIIMDVADELDIKRAVNLLKENTARFNEQKAVPFSITFSVGYEIIDCKSATTAHEFLGRIDRLMYEDKLKKN